MILSIESIKQSFHDEISEFKEETSLLKLWSINSIQIIKDLYQLTDLSKLIFQRYNDESKKDRDKLDHEPIYKQKMDLRISNVLEIELLSSLLVKLYYSMFSKNQKNEDVNEEFWNYFVSSEIHLFQISSLFIEEPSLHLALQPLTHLISNLQKINHSQRISNLAKTKYPDNKSNFLYLAESSELEGDLQSQSMINLLKIIYNRWWIYDDYILYYLTETSLGNYRDTLRYWNEVPDKIQLNKIRGLDDKIYNVKLESLDIKRKINFDLAMNLSEKKLVSGAMNYFDRIHELGEEFESTWKVKSDSQYETETFRKMNSKSILYQTILGASEKCTLLLNTSDENSEAINELRQAIEAISSSYDVEYISSISQTFESILALIEIQNNDLKNLKKQIINLFSRFILRFEKIINQMVLEWDSDTTQSDPDKLKVILSALSNKISVIKDALILIPNYFKEKETHLSRIQVLEALLSSLNYEMKALETEEMNKITELIYKTKAYYFAKFALEKSNSVDKSLIPLDRINIHYSGSFISALTVQMHLLQLSVQYLCLDEILPTLVLTMNQDLSAVTDSQKALQDLKNIFNESISFIQLIDQIGKDCSKLIDHRETYGEIIDSVKWEQIHIRLSLIHSIIEYYAAIKHLITAVWASKLTLQDKAVISIDDAQKAGFDSVKYLENIGIEDPQIQDFAKNLFSFSQFCQELRTKVETGKIIEVPPEPLFELLRNIVFAI